MSRVRQPEAESSGPEGPLGRPLREERGARGARGQAAPQLPPRAACPARAPGCAPPAEGSSSRDAPGRGRVAVPPTRAPAGTRRASPAARPRPAPRAASSGIPAVIADPRHREGAVPAACPSPEILLAWALSTRVELETVKRWETGPRGRGGARAGGGRAAQRGRRRQGPRSCARPRFAREPFVQGNPGAHGRPRAGRGRLRPSAVPRQVRPGGDGPAPLALVLLRPRSPLNAPGTRISTRSPRNTH